MPTSEAAVLTGSSVKPEMPCAIPGSEPPESALVSALYGAYAAK